MSQKTSVETMPKSSFGRRTFLKGSAATLGLAAATGIGCSPKEELEENTSPVDAPEEQVYTGSCRGNCFGGCKLKIKVRDGNVVSTTMGEFPNPQYNRICQKGLTHTQRIYDPDRLKTPMRRVGERGENQWEQISWEEAIDEIATTWTSIIENSGGSSIGLLPSAGGNFGSASTSYPQRLGAVLGATTISPCYDNGLFGGGGFSKGTGVNEIVDLVNAKTVIVWGANPSEAQTQTWHFIKEAQQAGATLIAIDPNYTYIASKSDRHITVRPGTDTAMVMGMMNIVIENDWIDPDFIKKGTVGPFLVKEDGTFLRMSDLGVEPEVTTDPATGVETTIDPIVVRDAEGNVGLPEEITDPVYEGTYEVEGQGVTCAYTLLLEAIAEWTPERVAELCDIPESTLRELTEIYTQNSPSTIYTGLGPDHYVNGHMFYFTVTGLAAITGNLGKPGATCGYDWPVGGFGVSQTVMPKDAKQGLLVPAPHLLDVVRSGEVEGTPLKLESLYITSANPVANQTDRKALLEAFSKIGFIVVADMTMTDTVMYADIVLPVSHWFEVNEIMPVITPYMTLQEKAIDQLHESKSDVEIINLIANKMGFVEDFSYTDEEYLEASLDNSVAEALGATWERLQDEKCVRVYADDPYYLGVDGVFPTPTGREQFYREAPVPYVSYGQEIDVEKERLPYWEPPHEAWTETVAGFEANPLAEKYPLIYTGERNKMKCHTQFGHVPWLLELYPEPIVKMHPDDASNRGIAEGDLVRIFNDRGEVVVKAVMHPGTRPGTVIVPKGWEKDQFVSGHYSDLTSRAYNTACANNCYFDTLVEMEKYKGGE